METKRREDILAARRNGNDLNSIFNNYIKNSPTEIFPFELLGLQEGEYLDFSTEKWVEIGESDVQIQIETAKAYQKWYSQKKEIPVEQEFQGIIMRLIPPGKFWMGSLESEEMRGSNETRHLVTLSKPFWCGKYPVTQAQWEAVMGNNPSRFKGNQNNPVEEVSWNESMEFCSQLGVHLLSEAQWEYACRGGTTSTYSFGNNVDYLKKYAWCNKNSENTTHPVGEKDANAFGLYDMHGNVWEWCEDYYDAYGGEATDPVNRSALARRVFRGGGWFNLAIWCRSAYRGGRGPGGRDGGLGLRVFRFL